MLSMERVGGTGKVVYALDSNSLSRSETSINWLPVSSGVGGSTDMPGTTAGVIDNFLLSLPKDMPKSVPFLGQKMLAFICVENRRPETVERGVDK